MTLWSALRDAGPVLIVFGGLPGSGKTSLARELAAALHGVYLRIDTIEQAIRDSSSLSGAIDDAGYRVAYQVARDNLRMGRVVISDSVNPVRESRDAWVEVGEETDALLVEVEVVCSDAAIHRQRVETRTADIAGLKQPTWDDVVAREYESWNRDRVVVDTAHRPVAECVEELRLAMMERLGEAGRGSTG